MSWKQLRAGTDIQHHQLPLLTVGKFGFHGFTSGLIVAWIALVACTLVVLERAVQISKERISTPWMYSTNGLPALLVTIVAQGHVAVTTMYITRLAISGLQVPFGAPRSWAEMFWLADVKWGGPVGIIEVVLAAIPLRIRRVSKAFLLFSIVSMTAFTLPLVLQSAYPVTTIDVAIPELFNPYTLSQSALSQARAYEQLSSGAGAWTTGQSVLALYNRTVYHPAGKPRGNLSGGDFFFAGDVQGRDMQLPGLRVECNCINRIDVDPSSLFPAPGDNTTFIKFCRKEIKEMAYMVDRYTFPGPQKVPTMQLSWCSNVRPNSNILALDEQTSTALFWYDASYHTSRAADNHTSRSIEVRLGVTHCGFILHFGTADLSGRNMTYSSFKQNSTFPFRPNRDIVLDPVAATLQIILPSNASGERLVDKYSFIRRVGYSIFHDHYIPPTAERFAERMADGILHMAAAVMVITRTNETEYPCTNHYTVSGFTKSRAMATGVVALLLIWLMGLLLATAMLLRPTFSDAMDSHVAARLLLHRPDLVEGVPMAPHEKNKKLAEQFGGVRLYRSVGRSESVEMDEAGAGNCTETDSLETQGWH